MAVVEVEGLVRVTTADLASQGIGGGGGGNTLYDSHPGDRTWATAPDPSTPDTAQFVFGASSLTVMVQTASVAVRFSGDEGANYGGWIVLPPGVHAFELDATDVQVAQAASGAEYQIIAYA